MESSSRNLNRQKDLSIGVQESVVVVVVRQKRSLHNVHKQVCQIGFLLQYPSPQFCLYSIEYVLFLVSTFYLT